MKTKKKVTVAFRKIYVLSIIQTLIERELKFTVQPTIGNEFIIITVDGFLTTVEAFPLHYHQIAYKG